MAGLEPSSLPRELSQGPGLDFEGFVRFMEGFVEGSSTCLQEAVRRHPQVGAVPRYGMLCHAVLRCAAMCRAAGVKPADSAACVGVPAAAWLGGPGGDLLACPALPRPAFAVPGASRGRRQHIGGRRGRRQQR